MSRSAVSPRVFQLYSPRRPSPLGLPPLAPHSMGSQDIPCSAYPKTPERYYYQHHSEPTSHGMRFPPDVHRRTSSSTQRARASPPAPLSLDAQHHPAAIVVHLPSIEETLQPHSAKEEEMRVRPSPTPSSTSSLSLYSAESAKKTLEIEEEGERKKGDGGFCLCFNFSALFGSTKSKPNKILAPQAQAAQVLAAEPTPAPQMVQPRRRPPSLVLVR